ncbi:unnamed protein product [Amoebophrya sp. A25]|nr:unnamed protein product [Amoebophrya sp. A25]|eukprot:GSA25T00019251001.1
MLADCELVLREQYSLGSSSSHSVLELVANQYAFGLEEMLTKTSCVVVSEVEKATLALTNGGSSKITSGKHQDAKAHPEGISSAVLSEMEEKIWQSIGFLHVLEKSSQSQKSEKQEQQRAASLLKARLRKALREHYAGGFVTDRAIGTWVEAVTEKAMAIVGKKGSSTSTSRLQSAKDHIEHATVPRLALLTQFSSSGPGGDDEVVDSSITVDRSGVEDTSIDADTVVALESDALERICNGPLMLDIESANPDWNLKFFPALGSVGEFCNRIIQAKAGAEKASSSSNDSKFEATRKCLLEEYLEVRAGVFVRIGSQKETTRTTSSSTTSSDYFRRCLYEQEVAAAGGATGTRSSSGSWGDNLRSAVAAAVRRYVAEAASLMMGATPSSASSLSELLQQFEKEVAEFYSLAQKNSNPHRSPESLCLAFGHLLSVNGRCFELLFGGSSSRMKSGGTGELTPLAGVFLRPYLQLRRPRTLLLAETAGRVHDRFLLMEMGKQFGVLEWQATEKSRSQFLQQNVGPATSTSIVAQSTSAPAASTASSAPAATSVAEAGAPPAKRRRTGSADVEDVAATGTVAVAPKENVDDKVAIATQAQQGEDNSTLCREIARVKGVPLQDVDPIKRCWIRPPEDERIRSLQKTLQGAVQRLAADLYSGESHFVLELLQNADDCNYSADLEPALCITVTEKREMEIGSQHSKSSNSRLWTTFGNTSSSSSKALLIAEHCEDGFRAKDVRALCDIAQSTKTSKKFIGHKGVGFKSVFKVTKTPIIHSGHYSFHFDSDALNGLGYLVPFPLPVLSSNLSEDFCMANPNPKTTSAASASSSTLATPSSLRNRGTRIVLPLVESLSAVQLVGRLTEDLQPRLLLFLRKLRRLVLAHQGYFKVVMQKTVLLERTQESIQVGRANPNSCSILRLETRQQSNVVQTTSFGESKDNDKESWFVHTECLVSPTDRGNADAELKIAIPVPNEDAVNGADTASSTGVDFLLPSPDTEADDEKTAVAVRTTGTTEATPGGPSQTATSSSRNSFLAFLKKAVITEPQQVFAWLPTRSYGFRFVIQADFAVATSREAVTSTDSFNQFLRDQVPTAFANAVLQYIEHVVALSRATKTDSVAADDSMVQNYQQACIRLAQLYTVIPLPGEGVEFFQRTPRAVLAALENVPFLFVRTTEKQEDPVVKAPFAFPSKFVRPSEALRGRLPPTLSAGARKAFGLLLEGDVEKKGTSRSASDIDSRVMRLLEPLVNDCGYHFLVDDALLPETVSQALCIRSLDGSVALACLEKLASATYTFSTENNIDLLRRLLFVILAFEDKPNIAAIKRLRILPVKKASEDDLQDEAEDRDTKMLKDDDHVEYVSILEEKQQGRSVYDAEFLVSLEKVRVLDSTFREFASQEPRVGVLLSRLGVQKLDSAHFCEQHVLPILLDEHKDIQNSPVLRQKLLACTLHLKKLLFPDAKEEAVESAEAAKLQLASGAADGEQQQGPTPSQKLPSSNPKRQKELPRAKRAEIVRRLREGRPWILAENDMSEYPQVATEPTTRSFSSLVRLESAYDDGGKPSETVETSTVAVPVHVAALLSSLREKKAVPAWWQIDLSSYVEHETKSESGTGSESTTGSTGSMTAEPAQSAAAVGSGLKPLPTHLHRHQGQALKAKRLENSWTRFWVEVGVWPTLSVASSSTTLSSEAERRSEDFAGIVNALAKCDSVKERTQLWIDVGNHYLVPHFVYYQDETRFAGFHEQLATLPWILNLTGTKLLRVSEGWLPKAMLTSSSPRPGPLESPRIMPMPKKLPLAGKMMVTDVDTAASTSSLSHPVIRPLESRALEKHQKLLLSDDRFKLEWDHVFHPGALGLTVHRSDQQQGDLPSLLCTSVALPHKPSALQLCGVIQGHFSASNFAVRDLTNLYAHLAKRCREEGITAGTGTTMGAVKNDNMLEVENQVRSFLQTKKWVWVPNHPRLVHRPEDNVEEPARGKKNKKVDVDFRSTAAGTSIANKTHPSRVLFNGSAEICKAPGKWYGLSELCFTDEAQVLDSYSPFVSDLGCDLVRAVLGKRCLAHYYWGPTTASGAGGAGAGSTSSFLAQVRKQNSSLLSPEAKRRLQTWTPSEAQTRLHNFFAEWGVAEAPTWPAYYQLLRKLSGMMKDSSSSSCISSPELVTIVSSITLENDDVLEVIERIMEFLHLSVRRELRSMEEQSGTLRQALDALNSGDPELLTDSVLTLIRRHSRVLRGFLRHSRGMPLAVTMAGGEWREVVDARAGATELGDDAMDLDAEVEVIDHVDIMMDTDVADAPVTTSLMKFPPIFLPSNRYWGNANARRFESAGLKYDVIEPYVLHVTEQNVTRSLTLSGWRLLGVPTFDLCYERLRLPTRGLESGPSSTAGGAHQSTTLCQWTGSNLPSGLLKLYKEVESLDQDESTEQQIRLQSVVFDWRIFFRGGIRNPDAAGARSATKYYTDFARASAIERRYLLSQAWSVFRASTDLIFMRSVVLHLARISLDLFVQHQEFVLATTSDGQQESSEENLTAQLREAPNVFWDILSKKFQFEVLSVRGSGGDGGTAATGAAAATAKSTAGKPSICKEHVMILPNSSANQQDDSAATKAESSWLYAPSQRAGQQADEKFSSLYTNMRDALQQDGSHQNKFVAVSGGTAFEKMPFVGTTSSGKIKCAFPLRPAASRPWSADVLSATGSASGGNKSSNSVLKQIFGTAVHETVRELLKNRTGSRSSGSCEATASRDTDALYQQVLWQRLYVSCVEPVAAILLPLVQRAVPSPLSSELETYFFDEEDTTSMESSGSTTRNLLLSAEKLQYVKSEHEGMEKWVHETFVSALSQGAEGRQQLRKALLKQRKSIKKKIEAGSDGNEQDLGLDVHGTENLDEEEDDFVEQGFLEDGLPVLPSEDTTTAEMEQDDEQQTSTRDGLDFTSIATSLTENLQPSEEVGDERVLGHDDASSGEAGEEPNLFSELIADAQECERLQREAAERKREEERAAAEEARRKRAQLLSNVQVTGEGLSAGASSSSSSGANATGTTTLDFGGIVTAKEGVEQARLEMEQAQAEYDAMLKMQQEQGGTVGEDGEEPPLKKPRIGEDTSSSFSSALSRMAAEVHEKQAAWQKSRRGFDNASATAPRRVAKADLVGVPGEQQLGTGANSVALGTASSSSTTGTGGTAADKDKAESTAEGGNLQDPVTGASSSSTKVDLPPLEPGSDAFAKLLQQKDKDAMFRLKQMGRQDLAEGDRDIQNAGRRQERTTGADEETRQKIIKSLEQRKGKGKKGGKLNQMDPAVQNAIGELGERQARKALMKMGFAVLWINEHDETGLPFDFLIRKADNDDFGREEELSNAAKYFPGLATLAKGGSTGAGASSSSSGGKGGTTEQQRRYDLDSQKLQKIFFASPSMIDNPLTPAEQMLQSSCIMVEVKATVGAKKEFFDVSLPELVAAWRFAERYWVLRIENIIGEVHDIRFIKNVPLSLQQGDCKIWMVC